MKLSLLFSGQGAQYVGMGKTLYAEYSIVKDLWDEANKILGFNLSEIAFCGTIEKLSETKICQLALYVHGFSLYKLFEINLKENININSIIGMSLGELTALAVSGVYSFEDGLKIVEKRGELMQNICENTSGSMVSIIGANIKDIKDLCSEIDIDISNINYSEQVVISGINSKIKTFIEKSKNINCKKIIPLNVHGAYHSRLMKPASKIFKKFLKNITFNKPKKNIIFNVNADNITNIDDIKNALVKQIYSTVLWEKSIQKTLKEGTELFLELGPRKILQSIVNKINPNIKIYSFDKSQDLFELNKALLC